MIKYPIALTMTVTALSSFAQSPKISQTNLDRIDVLTQRLIKEQHIAGASVLLIKDGNTIYDKAFGYTDLKSHSPMQTNSIFRIASQTKAITSVAAMLLWEEGKFLLDEPVSKYLPEFKNPRVLEHFNAADSSYTTKPAIGEITIRDLFRHTSGLTYPVFSIDERFNAIYAKAGISTGLGSKGTLAERITQLAKQPLLHDPGTAFTYGLNTDVLGRLIEIWSGVPLDEFLRKRLLDPLGMSDTYFHLPEEKASRLVALHQHTKNGFEKINGTLYEGNAITYPIENGIYLSGGAGLSSTTADYAKFLQLLLNKGTYNGKRLIGQKTIALMLTNQLTPNIKINGEGPDFQFGLGVGLVTTKNKYLYPLSEGSFFWGGAFNTHYWVDPKENLIGLVFTQEYMPESYWDLGYLFKNVVYASLED
jgi:CubicO group peptidase (beta-lactamase class C family)